MFLYVFNDLVGIAERERYAGIRAAVVDRDAAGIGVAKRRAGECNVLDVADALVKLTRVQEIFGAAVLYLPRLVGIENAGTEAVHEAVAALENAVVEAEPALARFDRNWTRADLLGFPALVRSHYVTVLAPVFHIGGLRNVHIAEGGVSGVGRTAEHNVLAVYFAREQNAVSVEGQECVFALVELLEIKGIAYADRGLPAVSVAPGDPESVLDPYAARIVAVLPRICLGGRRIVVYPVYALGVDVPIDAVLREAGVDSHIPLLVVYSENAGELIVAALKGNDRAVEDRVAGREEIAGDNGVSVIAPYNVLAARGTLHPRHIGNGRLIDDFYAHFCFFLSY